MNTNRREFLQQGLWAGAALATSSTALAATTQSTSPLTARRPYNVLFMMVDGQSPDLHSVMGGTTIPTPGIERIAARGTWFSRAYCEVPGCCPSRTAMLTGVHAARSGVYYNNQRYRLTNSWISSVDVLPKHFRRHGYLSAGHGFIAHGHRAEDDADCFSPGHVKVFGDRDVVTHSDLSLLKHIIPGSEVSMWNNSWAWGVLPDDWDRDDPSRLQQDTEQANRTIALLEQKHDQPFFAMCGFWRPHVSWTVPKRYFDRFPIDSIQIPPGFRENDLADVPGPARWLATHRGEHDFIVKRGLWKNCLQAYYASLAYADEQVGRVMRALEASPHRDNTIVVFTSDHGWHNGEKDHWSKFYLSEKACGVPLAISVPGMPKQVSPVPVSLTDLYPTLVSLCGLPRPETHALDGEDLSPLLTGAARERSRPVISTYGFGCHSLRTFRHRYTRYRNGDEELYDHESDPYELTNLAKDPITAELRASMTRWLPGTNAPDIQHVGGGPNRDGNAWKEEAFLA